MFYSPPCIYAYYSNSSVYIFHCLSKERFLHRKNRRISTECALSPPLYPSRVLGCTMISKREVSTPEKIEHLLPQRSLAAAKGDFYTRGRGNFCFTLSPASMHTILIQAPAFSDACAKRGYYTGKIGYNTLHLCLHGNALPLSQRQDFRPAQFVAATGSIQKKF